MWPESQVRGGVEVRSYTGDMGASSLRKVGVGARCGCAEECMGMRKRVCLVDRLENWGFEWADRVGECGSCKARRR